MPHALRAALQWPAAACVLNTNWDTQNVQSIGHIIAAPGLVFEPVIASVLVFWLHVAR
jgi:hypothetical protein